MNEMVRWLRIVAFLLTVVVGQMGWVGFQLLARPAHAQDVVDVQIRGINEASFLRWEPLPVRIVR